MTDSYRDAGRLGIKGRPPGEGRWEEEAELETRKEEIMGKGARGKEEVQPGTEGGREERNRHSRDKSLHPGYE